MNEQTNYTNNRFVVSRRERRWREGKMHKGVKCMVTNGNQAEHGTHRANYNVAPEAYTIS